MDLTYCERERELSSCMKVTVSLGWRVATGIGFRTIDADDKTAKSAVAFR